MTIAAFVISVLALLVAAGSGIYARRSAIAAKEVAAIEAARHHKERAPTFEAEIESVNDGGWFRLWLRVTSAEPLDGIEVMLDADDGIIFTSGQAGVDTNTPTCMRKCRRGWITARGQLGVSRSRSIVHGKRPCW